MPTLLLVTGVKGNKIKYYEFIGNEKMVKKIINSILLLNGKENK